MSLVTFAMIHLGYSRGPGVPEEGEGEGLPAHSVDLQIFLNIFCFDGMICVVSPLMLLYGSKELRKSLRAKVTRRFQRVFRR